MKNRKNLKAFISWSGGKESALSFWKAERKGIDVACILNMVSEEGKTSRAHGLSSHLLELQAREMKIPIIQQRSSWRNYEAEFKKAVVCLKKECITAGIFGDIDVEEHRDWTERVCREMDIQALLPLWKRQRRELLNEFIEAGFKAIVVAVKADLLSEQWLGREINKKFIENIDSLENIDLCGEKGEYHTFVYNGPIFFRPVKFKLGTKIFKDNHWFLQVF